MTPTPRQIVWTCAWGLLALFTLAKAGLIGSEHPQSRAQYGSSNILFTSGWVIQTNWLVEPKDRLLLGPFPRTQRFLEYGIVQSNLVAELVYGGKTNLVTLDKTPAMSITREYDVTITPRP